MKPKWTIYALVAIALIALVVAARGQSLVSVYGPHPKPERQVEVTRFHVCQALLNGTRWTDDQRQILQVTCLDPVSMKFAEAEIASKFTPDQLHKIFFAIGANDISKYRAVYQSFVLAEKRWTFIGLDKKDKADAWRIQFANWATTRDLNPRQFDDLYELSQLLNAPTQDALKAIDPVIKADFPGFDFEVIGPYFKRGTFCKQKGPFPTLELPLPDCGCSVGSSWNMSCTSDCSASNGSDCSATSTGCGFLGFFGCDGHCSSKDGELQ